MRRVLGFISGISVYTTPTTACGGLPPPMGEGKKENGRPPFLAAARSPCGSDCPPGSHSQPQPPFRCPTQGRPAWRIVSPLIFLTVSEPRANRALSVSRTKNEKDLDHPRPPCVKGAVSEADWGIVEIRRLCGFQQPLRPLRGHLPLHRGGLPGR